MYVRVLTYMLVHVRPSVYISRGPDVTQKWVCGPNSFEHDGTTRPRQVGSTLERHTFANCGDVVEFRFNN